MTTALSSIVVVFISCTGAPADHFSEMGKKLPNSVFCSALGSATNKFIENGTALEVIFDLKNKQNALDRIIEVAKQAHVVITDVGNEFSGEILDQIQSEAPSVVRITWYDNPESLVPGYSTTASKVMKKAQYVWFSNANLATEPVYQENPQKEIDWNGIERVGIGYSPMTLVEKLVKLRNKRTIAYLGGNNEEYFTKVFPAFLQFLQEGIAKKDLSHLTFLLQQHPGAKTENRDGKQLDEWNARFGSKKGAPQVQISSFAQSIDAIAPAQAVMYWQTSMITQISASGVDHIIQVGHRVFDDTLTRNHLCQTATTTDEFLQTITFLDPEEVPLEKKELIEKLVGIRKDWEDRMKSALQKAVQQQ
jgi:hypothetical protein